MDIRAAIASPYRLIIALRNFGYDTGLLPTIKTDALVVPSWLRVGKPLLDFAPRLVAVGRIHEGGEIGRASCRERVLYTV